MKVTGKALEIKKLEDKLNHERIELKRMFNDLEKGLEEDTDAYRFYINKREKEIARLERQLLSFTDVKKYKELKTAEIDAKIECIEVEIKEVEALIDATEDKHKKALLIDCIKRRKREIASHNEFKAHFNR